MAQSEAHGSKDAAHLCVLVHGLWGNPSHMQTIAEKLQEKHSAKKLRVLVAATNTSYNTYDGIEVGGERVAAEVEAELERLAADGHKIKRFSIVGYSLGGLVARYCIGLLYARGLFEPGKLEAVNFTTFASPYLGVRAPVKWFGSHFWNIVGSRTLSKSGSQMFISDDFRQTGKPLLSIMTDPSSIFIKALATFKRRILYGNIANDRSTPFYTTFITATDPFAEPDDVNFEYVPGYAPIIIDLGKPLIKKPKEKDLYTRFKETSSRWLTQLPLIALLVTILPLTGTVFFANAGYQTIRSNMRIKSHEQGRAGSFSSYRVPLMLERALGSAGEAAAPEYLDDLVGNKPEADKANEHSGIDTDSPSLALEPVQLEMIQNLNELKWNKYPVYIHKVSHSHAAIVVRWKTDRFSEGYTVIKHWLEEEFEL